MNQRIKLSKWAKLNGYTYRGAFNLWQSKSIDGAFQTSTGTILVELPDDNVTEDYTVVYSRVSSSENKPNLITQKERVEQFCSAKGWVVNESVVEVGSGLNDSRKKLLDILNNKKVTRIVVEHKDRLTRFGFKYIETLFGGEIIVINEVVEDEDDLIQDFVSLVTSFCARVYGKRRSKRNTEKLIKELNSD